MNPGELRDRLSIQSLIKTVNTYSWIESPKIWASKEIEVKKCVFSSLGEAAELTTKFVIRYNKSISQNNSILHNGKHYVIASILDIDNKHTYLEIKAAQVTPKSCELKRPSGQLGELNRPIKEQTTELIFPAYVTEKYAKYNSEYFANVIETYILITPKEIHLELGDLIVIEDINYKIQTSHNLNEYRNEFEIVINKEV